jgi:hypothetical protein
MIHWSTRALLGPTASITMRMTTTAINNGQDDASLLALVDFRSVSTAAELESPPTTRQSATKETPTMEAGLATATEALA